MANFDFTDIGLELDPETGSLRLRMKPAEERAVEPEPTAVVPDDAAAPDLASGGYRLDAPTFRPTELPPSHPSSVLPAIDGRVPATWRSENQRLNDEMAKLEQQYEAASKSDRMNDLMVNAGTWMDRAAHEASQMPWQPIKPAASALERLNKSTEAKAALYRALKEKAGVGMDGQLVDLKRQELQDKLSYEAQARSPESVVSKQEVAAYNAMLDELQKNPAAAANAQAAGIDVSKFPRAVTGQTTAHDVHTRMGGKSALDMLSTLRGQSAQLALAGANLGERRIGTGIAVTEEQEKKRARDSVFKEGIPGLVPQANNQTGFKFTGDMSAATKQREDLAKATEATKELRRITDEATELWGSKSSATEMNEQERARLSTLTYAAINALRTMDKTGVIRNFELPWFNTVFPGAQQLLSPDDKGIAGLIGTGLSAAGIPLYRRYAQQPSLTLQSFKKDITQRLEAEANKRGMTIDSGDPAFTDSAAAAPKVTPRPTKATKVPSAADANTQPQSGPKVGDRGTAKDGTPVVFDGKGWKRAQ